MDATAFDCPHCQAYARQIWAKAFAYQVQGAVAPADGPSSFVNTGAVAGFWLAFCERCKGITAWFEGRLVYPDAAAGPPPNPDLPDEIKIDYTEAQEIAERSPRGAAALLRLCVQKLCRQLGEQGKNINADIGNLVKARGLPVRVQQALDLVRVVGNEAVHPGQMDLRDDRETVSILFDLVNLIARVMISEPKAVQEVYDKLPQSKLDEIAKRDQPKP